MVRCQVRGPIEPLLRVLADAGVTELVSREPSLEELFLAQYGEDGHAPLSSRWPRPRCADAARSGPPAPSSPRLSTRKATRSGALWG